MTTNDYFQLASKDSKLDVQNSEDTTEIPDRTSAPGESKVQRTVLPSSQGEIHDQNDNPQIVDNNIPVLNGVALNDNASYLDFQDGNRMTLYHKPSHNVINVNLNNSKEEQVTLFFRATNEIINITFHKDAQNRRPIVTSDDRHLEPRDQQPKLDSVSDVRWRPVKVNADTLVQDYMKLAKIRLTGKLSQIR